MTPSYSELTLLHQVEEETQSEESSDDDDTGSNDDDEDLILSKNGDYEGFMLLRQDVLWSTQDKLASGSSGQSIHS